MTASAETKPSWLVRHWGKATAVALAVSTFLAWYEPVRNKGHLFLCDVAGLAGQKETVSICREPTKPPDDSNWLAQLEYLKAREEQLSPERLAQLRSLEASFEDRAFAVLMKEAGLQETSAGAQAEADTREAVRDTIEKGDADERRAVAMIAEGDVEAGLELLTDLASASPLETADKWRRVGRLAYGINTIQALEAYERTVALDPSDPWDAIYLGRLYQRAGALDAARRTYADALTRLPESKERDRGALLTEVGDVLASQGDLSGALDSYRAGMTISERLAQADPSSAEWQRDLSVSHERIGNMLTSQGDHSGALDSYRAAMAIRERLAQADPSNAEWQRDLSVSHEKVGDLEEARGDIVAAIAAYKRSRPIAEALADRFPGHLQFQSDVAITKARLMQLQDRVE